MRFKMPLGSLAIDFPSDALEQWWKCLTAELSSLSSWLAQPYLGAGKINEWCTNICETRLCGSLLHSRGTPHSSPCDQPNRTQTNWGESHTGSILFTLYNYLMQNQHINISHDAFTRTLFFSKASFFWLFQKIMPYVLQYTFIKCQRSFQKCY